MLRASSVSAMEFDALAALHRTPVNDAPLTEITLGPSYPIAPFPSQKTSIAQPPPLTRSQKVKLVVTVSTGLTSIGLGITVVALNPNTIVGPASSAILMLGGLTMEALALVWYKDQQREYKKNNPA